MAFIIGSALWIFSVVNNCHLDYDKKFIVSSTCIYKLFFLGLQRFHSLRANQYELSFRSVFIPLVSFFVCLTDFSLPLFQVLYLYGIILIKSEISSKVAKTGLPVVKPKFEKKRNTFVHASSSLAYFMKRLI